MTKFEEIRPYHDSEVNDALKQFTDHPMIKALLIFAFPEKTKEKINEIVANCHSIEDFQSKVIYYAVRNIIDKSSEGFSTSGFEKLEPNTPYLFISNHRDIILDTSLLNYILINHNLTTTASAIGDNLVKKPFLLALSKLNRNFLIRRKLSPREMLKSSKNVSEYIQKLLQEENRSVWIAQREGRTKDGDDKTQQGVLKMLALANTEKELLDYFKKLKIVTVSISYEFDPTDVLKMPELMAKHNDEEYIKTSNEDFNSILKGAIGQKKRIHVALGRVLDEELNAIKAKKYPVNKQIQLLTELIDEHIYKEYKLWPSNYVAYDLLNGSDGFKSKYTEREKRQFERRIERRVKTGNKIALENFLAMYANPVKNSMNLGK
ncbi:1-acyl-sn-glycerol-3-phosphate acyltransferase [Flavobacteriaceae bacterium R38]|nr:1-acyl-sn-glycerol-3-phosphate acyltransferase [Flavobacteriaceae bacterium R38]